MRTGQSANGLSLYSTTCHIDSKFVFAFHVEITVFSPHPTQELKTVSAQLS